VVADVAKYSEFMSNMSESTAKKNEDGTVDLSFVVRYTLVGFDGTERHWFRDDGAIDLEAMDQNDKARFRWEFHPTAGGTMLILYGYTDVLHSPDLIKNAVKKVRTLEHGFALANQLVQTRSMKARAEWLAKTAPSSGTKPSPKAGGLEALLDRGEVALLRFGPKGKLSDLAVAVRVQAAQKKIESIIAAPGDYGAFVDTIEEAKEVKKEGATTTYTLAFDWPLMSWKSRYRLHAEGDHADAIVVDGDLKDAHYRWEVKPKSANTTVVMLRAREQLSSGSLALRALFGQEPLFEPGFDVAFNLLMLEGVKARAEGKR
jgi:hypothetical protein